MLQLIEISLLSIVQRDVQEDENICTFLGDISLWQNPHRQWLNHHYPKDNVQVDVQADMSQQNINIDRAENQNTPRNKQAKARDNQAADRPIERNLELRPKHKREYEMRDMRQNKNDH